MNKHDICKCGGYKDTRAKQCTKCRKVEWVQSKIETKKRRYDNCICGKPKDKRATQCIQCRNAVGIAKRSLYELYGQDICKCGKRKSNRSSQCIQCHRKSIKREALENGHHVCNKCGHEGPPHDFWKWRDSVRAYCKECCREQSRRGNILRRCQKMGLSLEEAEIIATKDTAICEICGQDATKSFHIDHCHKTGKYRGLLCNNCNTGIGLLADDPHRLRAAANYIELKSL